MIKTSPYEIGSHAARRVFLFACAVFVAFSWAPSPALATDYSPYPTTVTPATGSGRSAVIYARFSDRNGYRDIGTARLLLNRSLTSRGAACFAYDQNSNRFWVLDGTRWRGGYRSGARATVATSFGTLYMRDTYAWGYRSGLVVRWHIGFGRPLRGLDLNTYVYVRDDHGATRGWQRKGIWSVPADTGGTLPRIFPPNNPWNSDISTAPVHPNSDNFVASMGADTELHSDFGTVWNGAPNGIPYTTVRGDQARVPISFYYPDESDPGPYPIPPDAPIEGGPYGTGDRHILIVDTDNELLYEIYDAHPVPGGWSAGSGAIFDLTSNALRPDGWTSADAAGLPMFPGLVRYDEVQSGAINHALRFTTEQTQRAYIHPATHFASDDTDPNLPPMGLRFRLKADYDVSGFPQPVRVVLTALKKYGMFVADNGGPWYISGAPDMRWSDEELHEITRVAGHDFEAVYTGPILGP